MKIFREISVPGFDRAEFHVDQVIVDHLLTHSHYLIGCLFFLVLPSGQAALVWVISVHSFFSVSFFLKFL
jgi:hypothetical protein